MEIWVGTSGWQYRDWRGRVYPRDLPQSRWLEHFSSILPIVEVNNTFYNLPSDETFVRWRRGSAAGFLFAVKASRFITHIRRLRDAEEPVRTLWNRCRRLGAKLGPMLFQLPPNLKADLPRLESFLAALPRSMDAAFEFRHPSWATDDVHAALDRRGCALVLADRPGSRVPELITGGWSYVRFHQGTATRPGYRRPKLRRWAERLAAMPAARIYAFFNNDAGGAAVRDAATLAELLRREGAEVRGPGGPSG